MHTTHNTHVPSERGRWASTRKAAAVMRLLRSEDLDTFSRELKVNASKITTHSGGGGVDDEHVKRLQAKVGELTMDNEPLNHKIDALETQAPFTRRRPKR